MPIGGLPKQSHLLFLFTINFGFAASKLGEDGRSGDPPWKRPTGNKELSEVFAGAAREEGSDPKCDQKIANDDGPIDWCQLHRSASTLVRPRAKQ